MRRLILMRHAKSDWNHPGLRDHERPLNKRGRASAAALGTWMKTQGHIPDQVLCSSAVRTGETLQGLGLPAETDTQFTRDLYHAEAARMLDLLRSATGDTILMVGHNPGICEMAHAILSDTPRHNRFDDYPTGATLIADFDLAGWNEIGWHQGQPIDFVIPRELM